MCRDLFNCTENEITHTSQGVIAFRRLSVGRDGQTLLAESHVPPFNRTTLMKKITAGILRLIVRTSILPAMQCFQYLRFG